MAHEYSVTAAMLPAGHLVEARDEVSGALRYQIYQPCEFADAWPLSLTTVPIPVAVEPDPAEEAKAALAATDAGMARAFEDFLAASGFDLTKLPAVTQAKLAARIALRQQISGH